jgi:hypothetical protein
MSRLDIQLRNLRSIPQAAPGSAAVARSDYAIRVRGGDQSVGAEIKPLKNLSAGNLEEDDVIGKIVCDQKPFAARSRHQRKPCGIGRSSTGGSLENSFGDPLVAGEWRGRNLDRTL